MRGYKQEFIDLALEIGVLRFGQFKLKSGRNSPYFFNSGLFNTGYSAAKLGRAYAATVADSGIAFDMLFGPAYKGIPLVALTAAALAEHYGRNLPFCFNRKEIKDHGEGGAIVGAPVSGRVLILDDVITAGTAIRETINLIRQAGGQAGGQVGGQVGGKAGGKPGAEAAGVVIALDRQERGNGDLSAIQEVEQNFGIPVASIIRLDDLVEHLEGSSVHRQFLPLIQDYRERYGVAA